MASRCLRLSGLIDRAAKLGLDPTDKRRVLSVLPGYGLGTFTAPDFGETSQDSPSSAGCEEVLPGFAPRIGDLYVVERPVAGFTRKEMNVGTEINAGRTGADVFTPDEVALRPRSVHFRWDDAPLHWIPGDPYGSHAVTALNLFVPQAERWFSRVLSDAMEYVRDDFIRREIIGFLGQEAVHASTHEQVLVEYLQRRGIDPGPYVRQLDWIVSLYDQRVAAADAHSRRKALASGTHMLCAAEHFTCVLGHWALNNCWDEMHVDPTMADFYRWHGAEEVEHRHVSYNVAKYFGMDYFAQAFSGMLVTVVVFSQVLRGTKFLVHEDPALPSLGYLRLLLKLRTSVARGSLPGVGYLLRSASRMLRRDYNPVDEGDTAQAIAYLAASPAARAYG